MEQQRATRFLQRVLVGIVVTFTISSASPVSALDVPPLTGRVVDLAHILPSSTVESLTARLAALEGQSSNQVAVLTIPSLEGESLEEFTHRVATTWKLGRKGTDNGVLLLVAIKERKVRIEVGYGLEGVLTDIRSAQIIRNEIVPRFRSGDMSGGVLAGTNAIVKTIEGTYEATESAPSRQASTVVEQVVVAVIVGLFVGLLFSHVHRFIGPVAGAGISTLLAPWVVPALLASGVTVVLLLLMGAAGRGGRAARSRGMDDWVWYSSRGGGWGGGSFGGGGGFSGGGGDFGGGGASGNW
ncbi:MAG: TPM domain-containing protein [Nitrospira sp.]|nr:TPM domain-containing protein [Nitrospira sp.]MDH4304062.1 TPM domain-containing protein [Nitrospira sp.]MDH5192928.1 TPM domain-containing protein [Nitrospira sp.]